MLPLRTLLLLTLCASITACGQDAPRPPLLDPDPPVGRDSRPTNNSCVAPALGTSGSGSFRLEAAFPALPSVERLVWLTHPPGDDSALYALSQSGVIHRFENRADVDSSSIALDISSRTLSSGEQGLLGLAFHPQFASNRLAYLYYSVASPARSRISRMTVNGDGSFDAASETVILEVNQPFSNHNGGHIAFGPDGLLYIGLGDGGSGGDPEGHGQNTQTLLGSMLRIDVDNSSGARPYAIPADNPFADGAGGQPEIYAWGLRNPYRWSFDRLTGELWAGDVGQNAYEEISIIQRGGNYGWNRLEGTHCYPSDPCDSSGTVLPVAEYGRAAGTSVTGGVVYRGSAIPGLRGRYLFGDFVDRRVWAVDRDAGEVTAADAVLDAGFNISGFSEDVDGEVFVLNYGGSIHRVLPPVDAPPNDDETVPEQLSETGCVNMENPRIPPQNTVSYAPIAAFWSDGASKYRAAALPDGERIAVDDEGDFELPVGSVLVKHFERDGRIFETRLFMRHNANVDGWQGYSYRWNEAGDEAILLPDSLDENVAGQAWHYPSRQECLDCHTEVAGRSLGLESQQLNQAITYPETGIEAQQFDTLEHINWMAQDFSVAQRSQALVDPLGEANLESRARAYLHTNCAMCHQPGGPVPGSMDLRAQTALRDMNICDEVPASGDLGIADARLLAPGDPDRSILAIRMAREDENQMPPIARRVVDAEGVALMREWISGLSACP